MNSQAQRFLQLRDTGVVDRTFYRQHEAFAYSAAFGERHGLGSEAWKSGLVPWGAGYMQLPVFGYDLESNNAGAKSFLVASYERFYDIYTATPPKLRFFYELIQADLPCHLHVDAEFMRAYNPLASQDWLERTLTDLVKECLVAEGVAEAADEVTIHALDASNDTKFSKHYIIKIKGKCFRSNYDCGAFMRRLCNHAIARWGSPALDTELIEKLGGKCLWVWAPTKRKDPQDGAPEKRMVFFADLAVYTQARQFRLAWSTKRKGTPRPLLPDTPDKAACELSYDRLIGDFMIQRCTWQEMMNARQVLEPDGSPAHSTNDLRRFRVDADTLLGIRKHQASPLVAGQRTLDTSILLVEPLILSGGRTLACADPSERTYATVPLRKEEISRIVCLIIDEIRAEWGEPAMGLQAKTISVRYRSITLWSTSHACRIAGREHGSNHISFKVSLVTHRFYQRCFHAEPPCGLLGLRDPGELTRLAGSAEAAERVRRQQEGYEIKNGELKELLTHLSEKLSANEAGKERLLESKAYLDMGDRFHKLFCASHPDLKDEASRPLPADRDDPMVCTAATSAQPLDAMEESGGPAATSMEMS